MRFVKHNDIPTRRSEKPLNPARLFQGIDRRDDPGMSFPRSGSIIVKIMAENRTMKAKTIPQFVLPVLNQASGRNNEDPVSLAPSVQLSKKHPSLDRFSQTDFVGNEHPPLWHLD